MFLRDLDSCINITIYFVFPQNGVIELKLETEMLARKLREKEVMMRQYKHGEVALQAVKDDVPNLRFQVRIGMHGTYFTNHSRV